MNTLRTATAYLSILGTLLFTGCQTKYLEGTVIKEAGSVANIVESSGEIFSKESIKFGDPTYLLQVQTDQGIYTIDVDYSTKAKTLEGLALALHVGDRISFPTATTKKAYFSSDRIGHLSADKITILECNTDSTK